jgi:hypothetical protein
VALSIAVAATVAAGQEPPRRRAGAAAPSTTLAIVANRDLDSLGDAAVRVHDYGEASLVRLDGPTPPAVASRLHPAPTGSEVSFRSWHGTVEGRGQLPDERTGALVIRLVGPLDPRWRAGLEAAGVELLAPAHPASLVVRADRAALERAFALATTEGLPVIVGVAALPAEARLHRSLAPATRGSGGEAREARVFAWDGRPLSAEIKRATGSGDLEALLDDHPEIGYVEPVLTPQLHNNLAARVQLIGAEEAWGLGLVGEGVTVLHNDSGVDLEHPALAGRVAASIGRMEYLDTAHGTHTAGSILGAPADAAPFNASGCGDVISGLPTATGMAPGATLLANNTFIGGIEGVADMMAWGAGLGAQLSNNSWGLLGLSGPEVGYSSAAVEVDAAVRDAAPAMAGAQPMAIFFSAGNTGPAARTVTSPGTAKNAITIGAVQNARCGAWVPAQQPGPDPDRVVSSSGRGPSQGRIKPDLVAPGSDVLSLESGDSYAVQVWDRGWTGERLALNTGTSQACALATGAGALLHEVLWRHGRSGRRPSPALLKAALIATADRPGSAFGHDRGWGAITVSPLATTALPIVAIDQSETAQLSAGGRWTSEIAVRSAARPLELALVWTDPPGEADADHPLVNDLDLVVTTPSGGVLRGNVFVDGWSRPDPGGLRDLDNNVEVVRVEHPETGGWTIEVVAVDVPQPPPGLDGQDFAIVAAGDVAACVDPPVPPAAVQAVPAGDNAIAVGWAPVPGASRYEVARAIRPGGRPYEVVATVDGGVTSFTDDGLSGGTTYHYVVRAEGDCWSADSSEVSATATGPCTATPVFAGIVSVNGVPSASCSLELVWAAATATCPAPVRYDVYRGSSPDFVPSGTNRVAEGLGSVTWLDRGLEPDRELYYLVRASHAGSGEDDGNTVRLAGRPAGPDDEYLDSISSELSATWLRVSGSTADSGTDPWEVTESDAWEGLRSWFVADEPRVKDQVLELREPIPLVEGEPPLLEFHHRMRLEPGRDGGRLEYSTDGGRSWLDILSGDGQTVPDDPDRFVAGGYTATIAAPANPLHLEDVWSGDSEGWAHTVVDMGDFAGLRVLLRWRFAGDGNPGGDWGWWVDGIRLAVARECQGCVPPDPPPWLWSTATGSGVELSWPEAPGAVTYRVFRSTRIGGPADEIATVAAPQTSHLDRDVSGGTTYHYQVRSDDGCLSDPSIVTTATATGPCTRAPDFWGLDEVVDRRDPGCALDLEWRPAVPGCDGAAVRYRVYGSSTSGVEPGPDSLLADGVAGPRYRDLTIADSETRYYRVRAVDGTSGAEDDNPVERGGSTTGPEEQLFFDSVEDGGAGWGTAVGSGADSGTEPWRIVDGLAFDGRRSWFCAGESRVKDQVVELLESFVVADDDTVVAFVHLVDLEPFYDGGRLEYSTDGGATWQDILDGDGAGVAPDPARFLRGGYSGFVSVGTGHPFAGEAAWTGFGDGWTLSEVSLAGFVGRSVRFRWRLGCDRSEARSGWWLDAVEVRRTTTCEPVRALPPRPGGGRRP